MSDAYKLSLLRKLAYGTGHVLNDLCASVWFSYLLVFLQYVMQVPSDVAGLVLLIGQVVDALATPLIGYWSDNGCGCHSSCRYGKRKSWHLIGTNLVGLTFPLIFAGRFGLDIENQLLYLVLLSVLVCFFQFGWAATQISHLALIPELTPIESERDELNIIRYSFDVFSDMFVYVIAWTVLKLNTGEFESQRLIDSSDLGNFKLITGTITGLGLLFSVIFHLGTPEKRCRPIGLVEDCVLLTSNGQTSYYGSSKLLPRATLRWSYWFKVPAFYMVAAMYTCSRLFINLSMVYMPLFLQDSLQAPQDMLATIPLLMNLSGFLGAILLKFSIDRLGKKFLFHFGSCLALAACVWVSVDHSEDFLRFHVYSVAAMIGVSGSILCVITMSLTADLIGPNTVTNCQVFGTMRPLILFIFFLIYLFGCLFWWVLTAKETGAFVYGSMSFCDKLLNGLAVAIIQGSARWLCQDCPDYNRVTMSWVIGFPVVIGSIVLMALK